MSVLALLITMLEDHISLTFFSLCYVDLLMAFVKDYIPPLQSGSLLSSASQDEKLKKKDCPLDSTMRGGREGLTRVVDKFFFFFAGKSSR